MNGTKARELRKMAARIATKGGTELLPESGYKVEVDRDGGRRLACTGLRALVKATKKAYRMYKEGRV